MNGTLLIFLVIFAYLALSETAYGQNSNSLTEQNVFFQSLNIDDTTELTLWMDEFKSLSIHPDISRLSKLKNLTIAMEIPGRSACDREGALPKSSSPLPTILIPKELFELPELTELKLIGPAQFRLSSAANDFKPSSSLKSLIIKDLSNNSLNFWAVFSELENLEMKSCCHTHLPRQVYKFKKMKKLSIVEHNNIIIFEDGFVELDALEELNLFRSCAAWPKDLRNLVGLKKITVQLCSVKELLNNGEDYYFPLGLMTLPNLEILELINCGRVELPPRQDGLKKLKNVTIYSCYWFGPIAENICDKYSDQSRGLNLFNLTTYPSLESIHIEQGQEFDTVDIKTFRQYSKSVSGVTVVNDKNKEEGLKLLINKIRNAVKDAKMGQLKSVLFFNEVDEGYIPDFIMPEQKKTNGATEAN